MGLQPVLLILPSTHPEPWLGLHGTAAHAAINHPHPEPWLCTLLHGTAARAAINHPPSHSPRAMAVYTPAWDSSTDWMSRDKCCGKLGSLAVKGTGKDCPALLVKENRVMELAHWLPSLSTATWNTSNACSPLVTVRTCGVCLLM